MSQTVSKLRDQWAKGIKYENAVCCEACKDAKYELHIIPKKEFKPRHYCPNTKKYVVLPEWILDESGKLYKDQFMQTK